MMRKTRPSLLITGVLSAAVLLAACSGGGGTAATTALDANSIKSAQKGEVVWCAQADSSGAFKAAVDAYNAKFGGDGYTVKLLEMPANSTSDHDQFVQRLTAKSTECDLYGIDVVWTAEFASHGWLLDLTNYVQSRASQYIPSTLETAKYQGKYWAAPYGTNVGFIGYRTDKVPTAPATWQELYSVAQTSGGYAYQGSAYEGLTVNFLEIATAAGGSVLSDDGKKSVINSPENLKALQLMVDGLKSGAAPRAVLTYTEEETRRAFEAGDVSMQRNWAYIYTLAKKNPAVADVFQMAPLPKFEGGKASAILGGVNLAVSAYSQRPQAALKAADFITSEAGQAASAIAGGQPSTLEATYDDPAVQQAFPYYKVLHQGIEQATSRPVTPVYAQVSQAIYDNIAKALAGSVTPADALKQADSDINKALSAY